MARIVTPSQTQVTAATIATNAAGSDRALVALQRSPLSRDLLTAESDQAEKAFFEIRQAGISHLFSGMQEIHKAIGILHVELKDRIAPPQLIATLLQPDSGSARLVQVEFNPASFGNSGMPVTVLTDDSGTFHLPLPSTLKLPANGKMTLTIHGGNGQAVIHLPVSQIASNGLAGSIVLPQHLAPLPVSILAALNAVAPPYKSSEPPPPLDNQAQLPVLRFGDCDDCLLQFGANKSIDKFPYGIFFRLIEPRVSVVSEAIRITHGGGKRYTYLPNYLGTSNKVAEQVSYIDRVPVDQPLSVDGFRDRLMGLTLSGYITADETTPMAGTLGLGYVLSMSQQWKFQGLALGDLVYSLPLAPGEQQQVAIFERRDTSSVFESEFFSESEVMTQQALADTSTDATFTSAFNEVINGRSSFRSDSDTSSVGGSFFGLISGGSGSSSSSGTTSSSLQGQRNSTQRATEATHSSAQNAASARRNAARTGMRTATASEKESVTTKTITNHNHTRALTMQYWEVLRLYDVSSAIDGLTMTVLVPLQVIRFLSPGQPLTISSPSQVDTRAEVLVRYNALIKHNDVLERALPRKYRYGLQLLQQFASDPTAVVEAAGGVAEDVINFTLSGSFLRNEDIWITAVTSRGTRVGPAKLSNNATSIPVDKFSTTDEVMAWLKNQRHYSTHTFTGALALPPSMNRNSIVGFEISRRFNTLSYTLISPQQASLNALEAQFGSSTNWITQAIESTLGQANSQSKRVTINFDSAKLEKELGGPRLGEFDAVIVEFDGNGNQIGAASESYARDNLSGVELTAQPYPIPALQLGPVLRFKEILDIEKMAQHVVHNTLRFSRAVWSSLSPEERAILLEAYTIGVPAGGVEDASQMVPLLNCVENRVLGFYGNSMIMPFIIPEVLAQSAGVDGQPIDPAAIQESLLAYQLKAFQPPHSTIALPTHGVLGEAVLGHCSSAEKIDLTRFWNWQDSPSDTAPTISAVTLPTESASLTGGLTAPNSLTTLTPLINNVLNAPTPDTALLQALGVNAAAQKDFDSSLTNATQLAGLLTNAQNVSNSARADALKTSKDLQAQAMATAGNIIGGIYGGNPTAGSSAAAAVNGQGAGSAPASGTTSGSTTGGKTNASGGTSTTGAGSTTGGSSGSSNTGGSSSGGSSSGGTGAPSPSPSPTPGPSSGPGA